jgi:Leu/Phe-tRNA-protein transferase
MGMLLILATDGAIHALLEITVSNFHNMHVCHSDEATDGNKLISGITGVPVKRNICYTYTHTQHDM